MNGDRVAGEAPTAGIGRGLNTLIGLKEAEEAVPKKVLLPTWFFFSADILLLAFAVAICFDAPKPMDLGSILFCGGSITVGAILGIAGVLREV